MSLVQTNSFNESSTERGNQSVLRCRVQLLVYIFSVKYLDKMSHPMKFLDQRSTLMIYPLDEMPFTRNGLTTEGLLCELSFRRNVFRRNIVQPELSMFLNGYRVYEI